MTGYLVQTATTAQSYDVTTAANEACEIALVSVAGAAGGGGSVVNPFSGRGGAAAEPITSF
jgi:hypothetical protein